MSPKEKKIKGDNANMLNSKGSFSYFFNTKYKQRIHVLNRAQEQTRSPGNPSVKAKRGFVFLCLCRYLQRLGYVKIKYHKRPSHDSTNACCIYNSRTWSTNHVHFNTISFKLKENNF